MKIGFKEFIAVAATYLVAVSGCYLFGYWGAFNVNVLEFIALADIAKLAIYPLLASLGFALPGYVISHLRNTNMPVGGGNSTAIGNFGFKYWRALLSLQILLIALVVIFGKDPYRWFVVAVLFSLLSTALTHVDALVEILPNPQVRSTTLFLALLLPGLAFAQGRLQADNIKEGRTALFVDTSRSNLHFALDAKSPVVYLGFLNGTFVLFERKTGQIIFVKQKEDSPLTIGPKPL